MSKKVLFFIWVLALNLCLNVYVNLNIPSKLWAQDNHSNFSFKIQPVSEYTLDNGLSIIIQENRHNKLAAMEIIVKTGSIFEGKNMGSGLAHLTEHMIFKGTNERNAGIIDAEIKSLGGTVNGYASHELTGYTLTLPSYNIEKGLEIFADLLFNPVIDPAELKKEKEVILNEIRLNRDDPERYIRRLFWEHAYRVAPFNLPVIGQEELFNLLEREDVLNFHKEWYVPNNMIISLAGDLDKNEILKALQTSFGKIPLQKYPSTNLPAIPPLIGEQTFEEKYEVSAARLVLGFPSVELTHPDSANLDIIATILGQGQSSRFYKKLLKEKQLVYDVNCYNFTPSFRGVFAISCILDSKNKQDVLKAIFEEIESLKFKLITENELQKAKNIYLSDYIFSQETVAEQAKTLATDKAYTGDVFFTQNYLKAVAEITPTDIKRCAQIYFSKKNFIKVILDGQETPLSEKTEKQKIDIPVKKITLDNGLRVILKKDSTLPIISVNACLEGGVRHEKDNNRGIFNLLSQMLTKGTKKMSANEIADIFESMGGHVTAFSGYNSFGLNMGLLSKDKIKGLKLFAELLLEPSFKQNELDIQKQLLIKELELEHDDIFKDTYNILKENIFQDSVYNFNPLGNERTLQSITLSQLKQMHKEYVCADNIVISVFGDFDEKPIMELIEKNFSKINPSAEFKTPAFSNQSWEKLNLIKNKREKEQAILMLGFPGCNVKSADRYALEFLSSMLCSPGSLLYKKIREKFGLSYTLGGQAISGIDAGFLFIYVATDSESVEQIQQMVIDEIEEFKISLIDQQLFSATKNYLVSKHRQDLESILSLGFRVALDELYGLGIDNHLRYEQEINSLDMKTIQDTAIKYLDLENCTMVITREKF